MASNNKKSETIRANAVIVSFFRIAEPIQVVVTLLLSWVQPVQAFSIVAARATLCKAFHACLFSSGSCGWHLLALLCNSLMHYK